MDKLDGNAIYDERFRHWKCDKDHLMGVVERVRETLRVNGKTLRYFTTRLLLFRQAVDLGADVPAEIDVAGFGDGRILSIVWRCSVCGGIREWHAERDVAEFVASTYVAE